MTLGEFRSLTDCMPNSTEIKVVEMDTEKETDITEDDLVWYPIQANRITGPVGELHIQVVF